VNQPYFDPASTLPGGAPIPPPPNLRVFCKAAPMSAWLTSPVIALNGMQLASRWGENPLFLAAGRYRVSVQISYMFTYGTAMLDVDVVPGRVTDIHYSAPAATFFGGAIGFEPQKTPGMALLWISWGIAGLMIVGMLLMFLFAVLAVLLN
jgi:hypothetical protein